MRAAIADVIAARNDDGFCVVDVKAREGGEGVKGISRPSL